MMNDQYNIKASWHENADEWISLLNRSGIASRRFTNEAIVDVVSKYTQGNILDMGCGEGWLTRALASKGFTVVGIDTTAGLIKEAKRRSNNNFYVISYEEIVTGCRIAQGPFDTIVFNYSLYENSLTRKLLVNLQEFLTDSGCIVIQTVHPDYLSRQKLPQTSQWIENAWSGLAGDFIKPHPWYARTMNDWKKLFSDTNFTMADLREIINDDGLSVSVIFVLRVRV